MPLDIFVSYSNNDRQHAHKLVEKLRAAGNSVWIDESGIRAAMQWSSEIVRAIESCKVFIILLSKAAFESHNVVKELSLASEEKKHILPVELEHVELTHEVKYQLSGLQRVSFKEYGRIEEAVRRFLNASQLPAPSPHEGRRHLLATMFTDIKGYSLMMNTDEQLAMKVLKYHNEFMRQMIESHEGRVVEIIGDAFLAVFESAVRAVETGIAIQEGFKQYNQTCPEPERFQVRIGIHLGDVIEEQGGVKGDAVNIAARIQAMAPAGGVAFSETIYNAVRHKTPLEVVSLGAKKLKNIRDPYTIYSLKGIGEIQTSSTGDSEPDILRLAVLPFEDLSPSHDNEWFADGMMDELIGTLGSLSKLIVPGRTSVMEYKKNRPKQKVIAEELEVRYLVEGTVRKAGEKIRISTSLTDARTNTQLWNNQFDGTFNDIFDFQERVAREITEGLKLKLTPQDEKKIEQKVTENPEAYELYNKANTYFNRQTKQDLLYALDCLSEAVKHDPAFATAFAVISSVHTSLYRSYENNDSHLSAASDAIEKARQLNPDLPIVYGALSDLHLQRGEKEEAIESAKKSIELDPKDPFRRIRLGFIYMELWQPVEAARHFEEGLGLDPTYLAAHYNLCIQYDRLNVIRRQNAHCHISNSISRRIPMIKIKKLIMLFS
jgi:adenylate cyclase